MNTKLIVDSDTGLREVQENNSFQTKRILKLASTVLSYIFHPVFVPVYIIYFLLFIEPFLFVGAGMRQKSFTLIQALMMYSFFPLVSVFLLRALKFIYSIKLRERKDRIVPFIICNIFYFWIWYVWRNLPQVPHGLVVFAMAVFLASSIGLMFNIYMKISMHSIALGTAAAFLCGLSFTYSINFGIYLSIAFLITGLVCTSRLLLQDHHPAEVYWGVASGALAVVLANIFV